MAATVNSAKPDAIEPVPESASSECLSEEEVLAFASGTLESSRHHGAHLHFDQCEVCQRLLSEAAHALAAAVADPLLESSEELSWHTTFQPGALVGGRYLIRHFIARGGMGEVYEAYDRELRERVALKTVTSTACDNAGAVRRLKAEVQLARRVSHPNVCRIYDFGMHAMPEAGGQISFLTMEFVDGVTLGQRVRLTGALPVDEARTIGRELLAGLSAAHEAGVLHRDFKSDNVMLRDQPCGGCSPLILDFGLARALDEGSRTGSSSTSNLLGTFGYIAPEQLQGQPHTTASDVYSLGLVWFEMLTGELPFLSPASPVGRALARIRGEPAAPSSINPRVPSDLDAVVLRCLRRSPKDRFRTAREALDALDMLEARARTGPLRRRLEPLFVGVILGGFVAYVATTPLDHRPTIDVKMRANLATPLPPGAPSTAIEPSRSSAVASTASAAPADSRSSEPPNHRAPRPKPAQPPPVTSATAAPMQTPRAPTAPVQDPVSNQPAHKKPRMIDWENPFDVSTNAKAGRSGS